DAPLWRAFAYEFETERLAIDLINGGPRLREWVEDPSATPADLDALAVFAATDGGNARRLGITGFCWGGRIVWLYAAHNPQLKAGVAWYGRLTGDVNALTPRNPIDVVGQLRAPVLGLYGTQDRGIPVSDVEAMNAALKAAGRPSEIRLFEADHGFLADYRPSYSPTAAPVAWAAALDWFRKL
ncbi:MAG: dienelactone hydrolase family protein, partial [Thermaurantiacus tibetensis]